MNYGLPYKGSKNKLAAELLEIFPAAECFVDVFAGGCAITHAALLSRKFSRIIANDLDAKIPRLFEAAWNGKLPEGYDRYISREEFEEQKHTNRAVACLWSFGNNCEKYLWNPETAGAKRLAYRLVMSDSRAERARLYRMFIKYLQNKRAELAERRSKYEARKLSITETKEKLRGILRDALKKSGLTASAVDRHLGTNGMASHYFGASQWEFPTREAYEKLQKILPLPDVDFFKDDLESLQRLERLESLQSLESLESMQRLERLESLQRLERLESLQRLESRLEVSGCDYRQLEIPDGAVVYCDPPYFNTSQYTVDKFDSAAFWGWCREVCKKHLLAVSEYSAPSDFVSIWGKNKKCVFGTGNKKNTIERLFVHKTQAEQWRQKCKPQLELLSA